MLKKIKKFITRVALGSLLALTLFMTAPTPATPVYAAEADSQTTEKEDASKSPCYSTFGKICSEVTDQDFEAKCSQLGPDICEQGKNVYLYQLQSAASGTDKDFKEGAQSAVNFLVSMQKFLNRLIWPVLMLTGGLMDNSLLFGSGMEARLREIWVPIRNIVNILFVIVLVGIALYNVLGIGDENGTYSIKSILPKLIVGIIAVNFSFTAIKVFLDAINTLTVSIFSLPSQVDEGLGQILGAPGTDDAEMIKRMCRGMKGISAGEKYTQKELEQIDKNVLTRVVGQKYQTRYSAAFKKSGMIKPTDTAAKINTKVQAALAGNQPALNQYEADITLSKNNQICNGEELTPRGIVYLNRWDSRNAALAMALNMGKIVFYEDVPLEVDKIEKLAINAIFSVMMWLIYAASFIALFIVLLARLVVMWLAIALSPILLLAVAVPVVREKISGFGEISSQFVKNAIAPLGIAITMTVGWVMLRALQGVNSLSNNSEILNFDTTNAIPVTGLSTLQDLIVALGTVAVVWLGVFTAASQSIAAPVTDMIKSGLQKAGTWVGTLPLKHAPIFPIEVAGKEGEKYTGAQVLETLRDIGNAEGKNVDKLSRDLGLRTGGAGSKMEDITRSGSDITDDKALARTINTHASDLKNGKKVEHLADIPKRNKDLYRNLGKTRDGKLLKAEIDRFNSAGDNSEAARREVTTKMHELSQKITKDRVESTSNKPPTPAAPAIERPKTTAATQMGDKSMTDWAGGNTQVAAAWTKDVNDKFDTVSTELANGASANKELIKSTIKGMAVAPKSIKDLQSWLGNEGYKKMREVFGSDNDIKIFLDREVPIPAVYSSGATAEAATTASNPPSNTTENPTQQPAAGTQQSVNTQVNPEQSNTEVALNETPTENNDNQPPTAV